MRNFDLAPLYRATVGFDRIADLMDRALVGDAAPTYPPYNIEKTAENSYRISIAVAGFAPEDMAVEVKENTLHITARKAPEAETTRTYLHRGIATRAFERKFALADHVKVTGASHEHGMLHIDLVRETPEALKPRRIEIARGGEIEAQAVTV
ncbi:MAG: Hsp20 family protein [Gemmobacter sp.]|nr:Hsp20 family protein [Gemmobacter sp.]